MKTTQPATSVADVSRRIDDLRYRERTTDEMIRALDDKIGRLIEARGARVNAVQKIRSALAQAIPAGHAAPERHANIH